MGPERQMAGSLPAQPWGSYIPPRCVSTAPSSGVCTWRVWPDPLTEPMYTLVLTLHVDNTKRDPAKTDQPPDYSLESASAR